MVSAISAFLAALPAIISMIQSLIQFIKDEETLAEKKALANKLASATASAVKTGDTGDLEAVFKSGQ